MSGSESASGIFSPPVFPDISPTLWIPPSAFLYAALIVTILGLVKQYIELFTYLSANIPRLLFFIYIIGAWALTYVLIVIAFKLQLPTTDYPSLQLIRSALVLGALFMLFGPFLILIPVRKIIVKRKTFFGKVVAGAQKKDTRYAALAIFAFITGAQGFVAYAIYQVLSVIFNVPIVNVIGLVVCYLLVGVFYLAAFYCTMLQTTIVINKVDFLKQFRESFVFPINGEQVNILDTREYLYTYVGSFCAFAALCLALSLYFIVDDIQRCLQLSGSSSDKAIVAVFFVFDIALIVSSCIFFLNEAFRLKEVEEKEKSPIKSNVAVEASEEGEDDDKEEDENEDIMGDAEEEQEDHDDDNQTEENIQIVIEKQGLDSREEINLDLISNGHHVRDKIIITEEFDDRQQENKEKKRSRKKEQEQSDFEINKSNDDAPPQASRSSSILLPPDRSRSSSHLDDDGIVNAPKLKKSIFGFAKPTSPANPSRGPSAPPPSPPPQQQRSSSFTSPQPDVFTAGPFPRRPDSSTAGPPPPQSSSSTAPRPYAFAAGPPPPPPPASSSSTSPEIWNAFTEGPPPRRPDVFTAGPAEVDSYNIAAHVFTVARWSVDDVCTFLQLVEINNDVVEIFRQHRVTGNMLSDYAKDDTLKAIGIKAYSDRKQVIDAITSLLSPPPQSKVASTTKLVEIERNQLIKDKQLGDGRFSVVFSGTYKGIAVAIKTPKADLDAADLIEEGALMLSIPRHPNVLQCFGIVNGQDIELVVELCNLGSLESFLKQRESTSDLRLNLSQQIARGLHHLSCHHVVHRDVATRNVMLHEANGNIVAKVADFGLSRQYQGEYYLINKNHRFGPETAPEVYYTGRHSTRSDVWSFGVLLWEVESLCATPAQPSREEFPPLPRPGQASDKMHTIMLKCWAIRPRERPLFDQLVDMLA